MRLIQDLRFGFHLLARHGSFTAASVATLALGIGANTAVFSAVDGVLLRPAPVGEIARLALIWETDRNSGTTREPASVPDYLDFVAESRGFESLAAFSGLELNVSLAGAEPFRSAGLAVDREVPSLLGISPLLGRGFTDDESRIGGPAVALIGEALWERVFGRDPAAVGATLLLDEVPCTILGVLPDGADFGILQVLSRADYSRSFADHGRGSVDVWVPLAPDPEKLPRETHPIFVLGRLAQQTDISAAQQELSALAAQLEAQYPENAGRGVFVEPFESVVFGPSRPALLLLLAASVLVMLVACGNVANLLLVRGAARAREIAVRRALGASGARLARQFLTESLVLTGSATIAGVGLAFFGVEVLIALAPPDIPRLDEVSVDRRVLGATASAALLAGLLFGVLPALQARGFDLRGSLSSGDGRASLGPAFRRLRAGLVVTELAMAVLLASGAGLLVKSFLRLQEVEPGFRAEGVLKAHYQLPGTRYPADFSVWPDFREMHAFNASLLERAAALPGVESVAVAGDHPLEPGFTNSFLVVGRESEAAEWPEISVRRVSPGYFATVGLPLVHGRLLREGDATDAAPVLVINEAARERFFGERDPIGEEIRLWGTSRRIVGVVADERFQGIDAPAPLATYLPLAQAPSGGGTHVLLLRSSVAPATLAAGARLAVHDVDPALAVYDVESLENTVRGTLSQRRFTMLLLGSLGAVALLLALIGVYGVLGYGVAQRTREIGIRIALGASPWGIGKRVLGEGAALAALGVGLGMAGALGLSRLLQGLLYGVAPSDPATLIAVAVLVCLAATLAAAGPIRRATRIDPALALRSE